MKSSYGVDLTGSPEQVWASLTDLDAVMAGLPGATLERDSDAVAGSLKTKLGVVQVTYRITARADIGVSGRHVAVVVVTGKEARGRGTLAASLTVTVRPGESAEVANVAVNADIDVTGRGAEADEDAWTTLLAALLLGVLPFDAVEPAAIDEPLPPEPEVPEPEVPEPEVPEPEVPEPEVPEPDAAPPVPLGMEGRPLYASARPAQDRVADPRMIAAVAGIVLVMLVWRRRRRK